MYWPDRKDVQRFYPQCFQKDKYVTGTIDCNEGILKKASVVKAQSQTYSTYKSRNAWKKLTCITSAGTYPLYRKVMAVVCQIDLFLRIVIYLINYNMVTI